MRVLAAVRRARTLAGLAAVGVVLGVAPVGGASARADTSAQAAARVQSLLSRVRVLQQRVQVAEGRYGDALDAVAGSVTAAVQADRAQQVAAGQVADAQQLLDDRVRGLYESGGQLDVIAALLGSGDVNDAAARAIMASRVVSAQSASVRVVTSRAAAAASAARRTSRREQTQIATERVVAAAASRVTGLLARERALLQHADAHLAEVRAAEAAVAASASSFVSITTAGLSNLRVLPPSSAYLHLYQAAARTCSGLSWTVLAAIGQVESGHGRNPSTSSAGAMGPMQFMPATFRSYAVDGDHDGRLDIMSPADSIFTAAHYLCANGAGRGPAALSSAILHYNHAQWYVDMVLKLAGLYASSGLSGARGR